MSAGEQPDIGNPSSEEGKPRDVVWLVSLALHKPIPGGVSYSMSQSWRRGGSREEAIASAVLYAAQEKPGFGVWETLVNEIDLAEEEPDAG